MAYFPFFIELQEIPCLVAGGGIVAFRKVEALLAFGASITVVAPDITVKLAELSGINVIRRDFDEYDLEGRKVVIAATDNRELNHQIAVLGRKKGMLVNVVDQKEDCNFLFPALVKQKDMVIGITSGGGSPLLSKHIKEDIEQLLPDYMGTLNEQLRELRPLVKKRISQEKQRQQVWMELDCVWRKFNGNLPEEEIENILRRHGGKEGKDGTKDSDWNKKE